MAESAEYIVHNNQELADLLTDLSLNPPSTEPVIVGEGNFSLNNSNSALLEQAFQADSGIVTLRSGRIDVAPGTTLLMPMADFGADGGRITLGELGVNGDVELLLDRFHLGSSAQLRLSGNSGTTHKIAGWSGFNISNSSSFFFEGISVGNAPSVELYGPLAGSPVRVNDMMGVSISGSGTVVDPFFSTGTIVNYTTYTATPNAGVDLGVMAAGEGYTGGDLAYYQDLEAARQQIIATADFTNPTILVLDEIFNSGTLRMPTISSSIPVAPANALVGLTVTNNVGAIVLWRQSEKYDDPQSLVSSALVRGQSSCSPCGKVGRNQSRSYDLWFQAFNAGMNVWSSGRDGARYSAARNGGVVGVNTSLGKRSAGGLVFGLSNPYFWDEREKVDLTDFQFGAHFETQLGNDWELGFYAGGGVQNGSTRRDYYFYDGSYSYRGDYNGNTFSATVSLSKVYKIGKRSALRPTLAIDTEHAWFYAFTETSDAPDRVTFDPNASLRHYDRNYYGRTMARLGVMAQTGGKRWGLNGRVFYSPQIGGKDYATAKISLADGRFEGDRYQMDALPLGRDMIVLGTGGHVFLNKKKTLLVYGDYNANLFKNATTQVVSLGIQKMF